MGKQVPPYWMLTHWLVEGFCFSQDIDNWIYIGVYQELPKNYYCRNCGRDSHSYINFFGISHGQQSPHAVGHCEKCNTVYWMDLKIRTFCGGNSY